MGCVSLTAGSLPAPALAFQPQCNAKAKPCKARVQINMAWCHWLQPSSPSNTISQVHSTTCVNCSQPSAHLWFGNCFLTLAINLSILVNPAQEGNGYCDLLLDIVGGKCTRRSNLAEKMIRTPQMLIYVFICEVNGTITDDKVNPLQLSKWTHYTC